MEVMLQNGFLTEVERTVHHFPLTDKVDQSIDILKNALNKAHLGEYEKIHAFRRLQNLL